MFLSPRPYRTTADLQKMCALLQAGSAAGNGTYYVHRGDVSWWLYYPPLTHSHWPDLYLWDDPEDEARLLAWALVPSSGETFDVYVQPELRGSEQAMACYTWGTRKAAENAARAGRSHTGVMWIAQGDTLLDGWLRSQGYQRVHEDVYLLRPLAGPLPAAPLAPGYCLRGSHGPAEVEARARAQYGAFESSAPFERYVERWRDFMGSPVYDPELDVVAAAPGGRIGAFCIAWPDNDNRIGLFEPVGTHPDFQRRGLGKAVLAESLRRLQERGMEQASVCTNADNEAALRLYEAVGFRLVDHLGTYQRKI